MAREDRRLKKKKKKEMLLKATNGHNTQGKSTFTANIIVISRSPASHMYESN